MANPKHTLHRVTLFVEAPSSLESPDKWNWDLIVNPDGTKPKERAPVLFHHAEPTKLGEA